VWIEWPPERLVLCHDCGKGYGIDDHRGERQWRHLDTMQFQTILHCRIPRVKCTDHGVKSIEVPWAEKNSWFTALFERLAMDVLLGCQNQTKGKELLKLSWDEVRLIHMWRDADPQGLPDTRPSLGNERHYACLTISNTDARTYLDKFG
jgi:transposase